MTKQSIKPMAAAVSVAFTATLALAPAALANQNPFQADQLSSGYNLASKHAEGKCGEGKCGGDKAKEEGKCGGDKAKEEGKCGEGKCGGDKTEAEGKCGEGKCGGAS